jgi:hypothetical protein
MNEETSLIAFKAICNFVNDLESEYGNKHKPLKLYKRLVNHTQISHDKAIRKHLTIFNQFCMSNRDALTEQNSEKITQKKIVYSEKVFINMEQIFKMADKENAQIIWKHLLTISAIVDPTGKAKEILKKTLESGQTGQNESDFLTNIISKVESSVKPDSNPMEAVSSIMQSGIFNDMMSDLGSKKLDLNKLLGAVQGMVSNLSSQMGDDPDSKNAMGMINNLTSMMNGPGGAPDMSGMMQMMTTMMAGMQTGNTQSQQTDTIPQIENITDEKK